MNGNTKEVVSRIRQVGAHLVAAQRLGACWCHASVPPTQCCRSRALTCRCLGLQIWSSATWFAGFCSRFARPGASPRTYVLPPTPATTAWHHVPRVCRWSQGPRVEGGDAGAAAPETAAGRSLQTIMDKTSSEDIGNPPFKDLRLVRASQGQHGAGLAVDPLCVCMCVACQTVLEGITELMSDLENTRIPITRQAPLHIHAKCVRLCV